MLYDRYKKRMQSLAKVFAFVKRYRIPILSILLALTALVTGLLSARGAISGESISKTEFVYGDEGFTLTANAFLSSVEYEYKSANSEEWTKDQPSKPGSYKVRAISRGTFGSIRYGKELSFTIKKRDVSFKVVQSSVVYGEKPSMEISNGTLAKGEVFESGSFDYLGIGSSDDVYVTPSESGIRIVRPHDQADVTDCYNINVETSLIHVSDREVKIAVDDVVENYNGKNITASSFSISGMLSVANGDSLVIDYGEGIKNVGSIDTSAVYVKAVNSAGIDVSMHYNITLTQGTITVEKRPVTVLVGDEDKTYDGETLVYDGYEVSLDTPVSEGHTFEAVKKAEITNVGEVDIASNSEITFYDENSEDVTDNYDLTFEKLADSDGKLKISKKTLSVTSASDSKVYDGRPFTLHEYEEEGLVQGEIINVVFDQSSSITDYLDGGIENAFTVSVEKANGDDSTDNYDITPHFGSLSIIKRAIKVQTHNVNWVYDGDVHEEADNGEYLYSDADLIQEDGYESTVASGQVLTLLKEEGGATVKNFTAEGVDNVIILTVCDASGTPVIDNYQIDYVYGKLTVEKRSIEINTRDFSWIYDGEEHYDDCADGYVYGNSDLTDNESAGYYLLPNTDHVLKAVGYNNVVKNFVEGKKDNDIEFGVFIGEDEVSYNFIIEYACGEIWIEKRVITLTSNTFSQTYNGEEITGKNVEITSEFGFVSPHEPQITYTSTIIDVLDTSDGNNTFDVKIVIDNVEVEDYIYENYEIFIDNGTITVLPRAITITSNTDGKIYDGKFFGDNDGHDREYSIDGAFVCENFVEVSFVGSITNVLDTEEQNNIFEYVLYKANGVPANDRLKANYDISCVYGKIEISKRPIELTSNTPDQAKIYDGQDYSNRFILETGGYGFVLGHFAEASFANYPVINVFDTEDQNNKFDYVLYKSNGVPADDRLKANYDISCVYGKIEITPRAVELTSNTPDQAKIYNGQDYETRYINITEGDFVLSHYAEALFTNYPVVNVVDTSDENNKFDYILVDPNGVLSHDELIQNYEISSIYGTITIIPRPVTLTSNDGSKTYDGINFGDGDGYERKITIGGGYGFVNGQDAYINFDNYPIKNANELDDHDENNKFDYLLVDEFGIELSVDMQKNYEVSTIYGTITIYKRQITITTHSHEYIYNGEAQGEEINCLKFGYDEDDVTVGSLALSSHKIVIKDGTALSVTNVFDGVIDNVLEVIVLEDGVNVSDQNYTITYEYGTIKVIARPIVLTSNTDGKVYDGQPYEGRTVTVNGEYGGLVLDHEASITFIGEIVNVWDTRDGNNEFDYVLIDPNGPLSEQEIKQNYQVKEIIYGTITINPRPVTLTSNTGSKIYDGLNYGDGDGYERKIVVSSGNFVLEHYPEADFSASIIVNVVDTIEENNKFTFTLVDPNDVLTHEKLIQNYDITCNYGTITINPRPVTLTSATTKKMYDGTALVYDKTVSASSDLDPVFVLGDGFNYNCDEQTIINVWDSTYNTFTYTLIDVNGNALDDDHVQNYEITVVNGELTITKRPIKIITHSHEWIYDGNAHGETNGCSEGNYVGEDLVIIANQYFGLVSGQIIEVDEDNSVKITDVGEIDNKASFIIMDSDTDVTENYQLSYEYGKLKITTIEITIISQDGSKIYDGTPCETAKPVVNGNLLSGHFVQTEHTEIINVSQNKPNNNTFIYKIVDEAGNDYTRNYKVTTIYGTIEIIPRPIMVKTHNHSWTYDGLAHYDGDGFCYDGYTVADIVVVDGIYYELLEGHKISVDLSKEHIVITDPCSVDNNLIYFKIQTVVDGVASDDVTDNYAIVLDLDNLGTLSITKDGNNDGNGGGNGGGNGDGDEGEGGEGGNGGQGGDNGEGGEGGQTPGGNTGFPDSGKIDGTSPGLSDSDRDNVMLYITSTKDGVIYLRSKSFGDYDVIDNEWKDAVQYETDGVNPLYYFAYALKEAKISPNGLIVKEAPDVDDKKYFTTYYVDQSGSETNSDIELYLDWVEQYYLSYYNYSGEDLVLPDELIEAENAYSAFVNANYLKLDVETKTELLKIAEANNISKDSATIINDIAKFVSEKVEYNLDFTSQYQGNYVLYFFNSAHDGICQHYAMAATAMYRAMGIPARYTIGFATQVSANQETEVLSGDGHAWVEVYVDGLGWVQVEVTGGMQSDRPFPEIGEEQKTKLFIKPMDYAGSSEVYNKSNPLVHDGKIVDQDGYNDWYILTEEKGYTYHADVSGSIDSPGYYITEIDQTTFAIYDENGQLVTDKFEIDFGTGRLDISNYFIFINIEECSLEYNGKPQSYYPDTEWWIDEKKSTYEQGIEIEIDFASIWLTEARRLTKEEMLEHVIVTLDGEVVDSDKYLLDFSELLLIKPRNITVVSGSAKAPYTGEALVNKNTYISFNSLADGHTMETYVNGALTSVGTKENEILKIIIYDAEGKIVYDSSVEHQYNSYNVTKEYGLLEVY